MSTINPASINPAHLNRISGNGHSERPEEKPEMPKPAPSIHQECYRKAEKIIERANSFCQPLMGDIVRLKLDGKFARRTGSLKIDLIVGRHNEVVSADNLNEVLLDALSRVSEACGQASQRILSDASRNQSKWDMPHVFDALPASDNPLISAKNFDQLVEYGNPREIVKELVKGFCKRKRAERKADAEVDAVLEGGAS